jgi:hypothetical protein
MLLITGTVHFGKKFPSKSSEKLAQESLITTLLCALLNFLLGTVLNRIL